MNTFNAIFALLSVCIAYWSVYKQHLIIAEVAFNLWRVEYQIVVFIILIMLLHLTAQERTICIMQPSPVNSPTISNSPSANVNNINVHNKTKKKRMLFVMLTARTAILV